MSLSGSAMGPLLVLRCEPRTSARAAALWASDTLRAVQTGFGGLNGCARLWWGGLVLLFRGVMPRAVRSFWDHLRFSHTPRSRHPNRGPPLGTTVRCAGPVLRLWPGPALGRCRACAPGRALLPQCRRSAAAQTLGICGAPPGDNCNHQEASRKEQKPPQSLWDLLATIQKIPGRQVLCLQRRFSGVVRAVWVGASWDGAPGV